MSELLHQRENSSELENHLKDNGEKFNRQCVMVLRLLYSGKRFTGKQVNEILNIACGDRRLRDLFVARNDVKRQWVYTEDGKKTRWKEYWLEIPKPITKSDLQKFWNDYQNETPVIDINRRHYTQQNLFNNE